MSKSHVRHQYDTVQPIVLVDVQVADLTAYPPTMIDYDGAGWTHYFRMWALGASTLKISDAPAQNPDSGVLRYDPATADVDTDGRFVGQFLARLDADPTEIVMFPPFDVEIRAVQGGAPA